MLRQNETGNVSPDEARANIADYVFPKITQVHEGRRLIIDQLPLVYHPPPEEKVPEIAIDSLKAVSRNLAL